MSEKINIIDYNICLELLIYSVIVYDINIKNNKLSLDNIIDKNLSNYNKIIQKKYTKNKYDNLIKFFYCDITHIFCIIIKNDKEKKIKIIFKGSTDDTHLEYNLKIKLKKISFLDDDKIKIHTGFYRQIFEGKLYQKVISYLKLIYINDYDLYFTGHSLGGIMSILFGYFCSFVFTNKIIITSFGGCKIGNKYFCRSFNKRDNIICYRINNKNDLIPYIPLINYKNVGMKIEIGTNNDIDLFDQHNHKKYLINLLKIKW